MLGRAQYGAHVLRARPVTILTCTDAGRLLYMIASANARPGTVRERSTGYSTKCARAMMYVNIVFAIMPLKKQILQKERTSHTWLWFYPDRFFLWPWNSLKTFTTTIALVRCILITRSFPCAKNNFVFTCKVSRSELIKNVCTCFIYFCNILSILVRWQFSL